MSSSKNFNQIPHSPQQKQKNTHNPALTISSAVEGPSKQMNKYPSRLKFKTQVCRYWANNNSCIFGQKCVFAHGADEKRRKEFLPTKYKTSLCVKFQEDGYCSYGLRCKYIHNSDHFRVTTQSRLDCLVEYPQRFFCFLEETEKNVGKTHRLGIFQQICDLEKDEVSTLWTSTSDEIVEQQSFISNHQIRSRQGSL